MKIFQSIPLGSLVILLLRQTKTAKSLAVRNHRHTHLSVGLRQCSEKDYRNHRFVAVSRCNGLSISRLQSYKSGIGGQDEKNHRRSDKDQTSSAEKQTRRAFLSRSAISISGGSAMLGTIFPTKVNARGLVLFPCKDPLLNTYHFMRAGASLLEVEDVWSTNPLFLTNREAALSEMGEMQVLEACKFLKEIGSSPTVVRYSLAAASVDSANIIGDELKIGRDRLVPEFNYLDPRAIGGWDFAAMNATEEAVWALDADEAGPSGRGGKPPPNEDGTPAETLSDQVVRLTNLMSVLETLYSGDTVLLVFPDGTGPALLSCLIGGIPLNRVHEFNYQPGEIRCNIDYDSVNALSSQPPSQSYNVILQRGRNELKQLRENPNITRNTKDLKFEEEKRLEELELEKKRKEDESREKVLGKHSQKAEPAELMQKSGSYESSIDAGMLSGVAVVAGISGIVAPSFGSSIGSDGGGKHQDLDATIHISGNFLLNNTEIALDSANSTFLLDNVQEDNGDGLEIIDDIQNNDFGADALADNDEFTPSQLDYDEAWLGMITEIVNDSEDEEYNC